MTQDNDEVGKWMDIETAPQDGRGFLVGRVNQKLIDRAFYMNGRLVIVGGQWTPTHGASQPARA